MQSTQTTLATDKVQLTGLLLIACSALLFIFPDLGFMYVEPGDYFGIFIVHYVIASVYLVMLFINGLLRFWKDGHQNGRENMLLLLVLYLISAFALNREVSVFEDSAAWVCVYLVLLCLASMLVGFRNRLPFTVNIVLCFILGAGMPLYFYYAFYLMPTYPFCLIGGIFFGISLHVFTPMLFACLTFSVFLKMLRENKRFFIPFIAGAVLPLLFACGFVIRWNMLVHRVNYMANETVIKESSLPSWVRISQQLPRNGITEKMLKTNLVYSFPESSGIWDGRMPSRAFDDVKKHDPLVITAAALGGRPTLNSDEKIHILEAMYDSRHQAQERLWSGRDLQTINVISNIRIFPAHRLAYTEKVISVGNNNKRHGNQQEAIYTFHLPEGGTVTSLSLWINGREEKALLTTKHKADSAYKMIVGVQYRDPSVLHWQEGNTVSVRVFPCSPQEHRRFKIGVTAPLLKDGAKLVYQNIFFDGPDGRSATESVQLQFDGPVSDLKLPFSCKQTGNVYKADKRYDPYWEIGFAADSVSSEAFSFNGNSYWLSEHQPTYMPFDAQTIYADLNSAWTKEELHMLFKAAGSRNVYACLADEPVLLTSGNLDALYETASAQHFSLFPFQRVKDPEHALLVSKSSETSPNLHDLASTAFAGSLSAYLAKSPALRLYNIGNELSPYLKTLKELRVFTYDHGSIDQLAENLRLKRFAGTSENDSTVVIDQANLEIHRSHAGIAGKGPDHLLRLFAYNDVMRKAGTAYFNGPEVDDALVAEAAEAYVVSPVSSLVVLETQNDYKQFNIEQSKNSLQNASVKSSGAVPEPHEWVLIILAVLTMGYLVYKPKLRLS